MLIAVDIRHTSRPFLHLPVLLALFITVLEDLFHQELEYEPTSIITGEPLLAIGDHDLEQLLTAALKELRAGEEAPDHIATLAAVVRSVDGASWEHFNSGCSRFLRFSHSYFLC